MPDPLTWSPSPGPLELLIIQPSPFCNLDCDYCYLPARNSTRRMSEAVLDQAFRRTFESGLVGPNFTVVWHAGEPLAVPLAFYERAMELLARHAPDPGAVCHAIQTNGTLIDQPWCDFIRSHRFQVGVSIDGPAFLHDAHRRTRHGRGTLGRTINGLRQLQANGIPFHVIAVLTRQSLDYPDEIFDFFQELGVGYLGFNVEEVEGPHATSSLQAGGARSAMGRFLSRFYDLVAGSPEPAMVVREFEHALEALRGPQRASGPPPPGGGREDGQGGGQQTRPFAIVNIDVGGNFSTYSPELLGIDCPRYHNFILGNVFTDSFRDAAAGPVLRAIHQDVAAGIERCRQSCDYFPWCGGGAPANKYFENGSFDSDETMFCRLTRKAVLDVVMEKSK